MQANYYADCPEELRCLINRPRGGVVPRPKPNSYRRWQHMIQRCHNPNDGDYPRWGAKGVRVCVRWRFGTVEKSGYWCFIEDMGEPPTRAHSIDRLENAPVYSKETCRWATVREQMNNRTTTRKLTYRGETKPLTIWADELGVGPKTILYRLKQGLTDEQALTTPVSRANRLKSLPKMEKETHHG